MKPEIHYSGELEQKRTPLLLIDLRRVISENYEMLGKTQTVLVPSLVPSISSRKNFLVIAAKNSSNADLFQICLISLLCCKDLFSIVDYRVIKPGNANFLWKNLPRI